MHVHLKSVIFILGPKFMVESGSEKTCKLGSGSGKNHSGSATLDLCAYLYLEYMRIDRNGGVLVQGHQEDAVRHLRPYP